MYAYENTVGLDFESYSDRILRDVGMTNYMNSPHFTPLIGDLAQQYGGQIHSLRVDFIGGSHEMIRKDLEARIADNYIAAHHASFEARVLRWVGLDYPADRFADSEVISRCAGGGGRLEAAAAQLLGTKKGSQGKNLIRTFSIPSKQQLADGDRDFDMNLLVSKAAEWQEFIDYCHLDALLGLRLAVIWGHVLTKQEHAYMAMTMEMNETGWFVNMDVVEEMQRQFEENKERALADFRSDCNEPDLNLNSYPQQKVWCLERGVKVKSFDKENVARLIPQLEVKLDSMTESDPKYKGYDEVLALMYTKRTLGGSSLSKLARIRELTSEDSRLRDQYAHCGAGQTWRAAGRGVQLQNLKRLDAEDLGDMTELWLGDWDNDKLAENIRQCFEAEHPEGEEIVADLQSVESRGLAYLAGQDDKLEAFRSGKDMYKVMATTMYHVDYDAVLKSQRQMGKVGELSCGYGAGDQAVKDFASKMFIEMTLAEAATLVADWRLANPKIVKWWWKLDEMLHECVEKKTSQVHQLAHDNLTLRILPAITPSSINNQHPGAQSIEVLIVEGNGEIMLRRIFHGCYVRGRNISYYKPDTRESSQLWRNGYINPKTKVFTYYSVYGGKLAGILVQSFCRELFMRGMKNVRDWCEQYPDRVKLHGQFHDEVVVEWTPHEITGTGKFTGPDLGYTLIRVEELMLEPGNSFPSFPLGVDVKHDHRYTK